MANNYQQCSFAFPICSPDERAFLDSLKTRADAAEERDEEAEGDVPPFEISVVEFGWSWTSAHDATNAIFYTDGGNIDAMVIGLQEFLARFRGPTETIAFTWSFTCDKPRIDDFSGGGIAFTATKSTCFDAQQSVMDAEKALQAGE